MRHREPGRALGAVTVVALGLFLVVGVPRLMEMLGPAGSPEGPLGAALALVYLYGLVCGAILLAGERENGTLGYLVGDHRLNLRANYFSGFRDDSGNLTGNSTPVARVGTTIIYPSYGVKPFKSYMDFDFTYSYTAPFWQDLKLRLSVLNILDKDPLAAQHSHGSGVSTDNRTGYYTSFGNVRGRQIEVGVTKKF